MNRERNQARTPAGFDWVVLAILAVTAIVCGIVQVAAADSSTTRLETALFNVLQFFFSIGLGWSITRIATQQQFEKSLKGFAFSAYRRIVDIGILVRTLDAQVASMRGCYDPGRVHELDQVRATLGCAELTIRSSISDWADVIGPELDAIEELDRLQTERRVMEYPGQESPSSTGESRLKDLEKQIRQLKDLIPRQLRQVGRAEPLSLREVSVVITAHHNAAKGLVLGALFEPGFEETRSEIGSPVGLGIHGEGTASCVGVHDLEGHLIGRVTNLLADIGGARRSCTYEVFQAAIASLLPNGRRAKAAIVTVEDAPWSGRRLFWIKVGEDQLPVGEEVDESDPRVQEALADGNWTVLYPGKGHHLP